MKFKFDIVPVLKRHITTIFGITPIFVLLSLTIATRLLLIINAPVMYHFDSYGYISKAIDLSSRGEIQLSVGMPFVIFLGVPFYIFGSTLGVILVSRILMVLLSTLLIYVIYLLGLRMSGKLLGFIAALLAIFEPFFLSYSIVPHNDIFVVALTLVAVYFVASKTRFSIVLALIFTYIVVFTRPEFLVVLAIPMLVFYFLKLSKAVSVRAIMKFVLLSSLYISPFIWVSSIYPTVTRFSVIEKFTLFLRPDLLKLTLESLFKFYDQEFLNQIFFALFGLGIGLALLNTLGKFIVFEKRGKAFSIRQKKDKSIKEVFLSDRAMVTFCLFLLSLIHIVILTVYGYGYFIVDGTLTIVTWFPERYLILTRVLLSYPLAYVLSIVVQEVYAKVAR